MIFFHDGQRGNGLWERYAYAFRHAEPFIVRVRNLCRTLGHADAASVTLYLIDVARLLENFHSEVGGGAFKTLNHGIADYIDIRMASSLNQFRR